MEHGFFFSTVAENSGKSVVLFVSGTALDQGALRTTKPCGCEPFAFPSCS